MLQYTSEGADCAFSSAFVTESLRPCSASGWDFGLNSSWGEKSEVCLAALARLQTFTCDICDLCVTRWRCWREQVLGPDSPTGSCSASAERGQPKTVSHHTYETADWLNTLCYIVRSTPQLFSCIHPSRPDRRLSKSEIADGSHYEVSSTHGHKAVTYT